MLLRWPQKTLELRAGSWRLGCKTAPGSTKRKVDHKDTGVEGKGSTVMNVQNWSAVGNARSTVRNVPKPGLGGMSQWAMKTCEMNAHGGRERWWKAQLEKRWRAVVGSDRGESHTEDLRSGGWDCLRLEVMNKGDTRGQAEARWATKSSRRSGHTNTMILRAEVEEDHPQVKNRSPKPPQW